MEMKKFFLVVMALVFCFAAFADSKTHPGTSKNDEMTWCIARPSTDSLSLYTNINFSCGQGGVDCSTIKKGGYCFLPDNMYSHASYAMNLYYRSAGKNAWNCDFKNTGLIVSKNPSFGSCYYPDE